MSHSLSKVKEVGKNRSGVGKNRSVEGKIGEKGKPCRENQCEIGETFID
jgi:hypothetical protein